MENVEYPGQYIPAVLKRVKTVHLERTYDVRGWNQGLPSGQENGPESARRFLELLARKAGRLLKGGEPDSDGVARMVLNDFLRGRLPWFTPVPKVEGKEGDDDQEKEKGKESNNEAVDADRAESKKRKRSDEAGPERTEADSADAVVEKEARDQIEDSFEGFPAEPQLPLSPDAEHSDDNGNVPGENELDDGISHHDTDEERLIEEEIVVDEMAYANNDGEEEEEEGASDDEDSDDGGGGVGLGGRDDA